MKTVDFIRAIVTGISFSAGVWLADGEFGKAAMCAVAAITGSLLAAQSIRREVKP